MLHVAGFVTVGVSSFEADSLDRGPVSDVICDRSTTDSLCSMIQNTMNTGHKKQARHHNPGSFHRSNVVIQSPSRGVYGEGTEKLLFFYVPAFCGYRPKLR